MSSRVLITGGCGFIGSHLVDECLAIGSVKVLDDLSTGKLSNIEETRSTILVGSITDKSVVREAITGCSTIFHLAALPSVPRSIEDLIGTAQVNIMGTLNILEEAAIQEKRVIVASSSSVYGGIGQRQYEGQPLEPKSPYAVQKMTVEQMCEQYNKHKGLEVVCLRFFNVYGPRQRADSPYAGAIPNFIAAKEANRSATIHGDGKQMRDFTYVKDAVSAIIAVANSSVSYDILNVARGESSSVLDLHKLIGSSIPPTHLPPRKGDVARSRAGIEKIRNVIGWVPEYDLKEGLEEMMK